jgi:TPR repeat protein
LGCHHFQGVVAQCYLMGDGCEEDEARSLELARESSVKGSRYGQYVLGLICELSDESGVEDCAQKIALYRLAAAQNLDDAQLGLGSMYYNGWGVAQDFDKAVPWYQLAAAQGNPTALRHLGSFHERGEGVPKNKDEAIRLYRRAQAAGYTDAADDLQRLCT